MEVNRQILFPFAEANIFGNALVCIIPFNCDKCSKNILVIQ